MGNTQLLPVSSFAKFVVSSFSLVASLLGPGLDGRFKDPLALEAATGKKNNILICIIALSTSAHVSKHAMHVRSKNLPHADR